MILKSLAMELPNIFIHNTQGRRTTFGELSLKGHKVGILFWGSLLSYPTLGSPWPQNPTYFLIFHSVSIFLHGSLPFHGEGVCITWWSYEPCPAGPLRWMGHSEEFRKLNIKKRKKKKKQKPKIMTSGPITSWQIEGEMMEAVTSFFLGSKITVDGDCSYEIRRQLLLERKAMTNLDRVLKSRDITLLTKVRLVKAMVFAVVMYGCERWTIKTAEYQRIDAFELWCWRRLLVVESFGQQGDQTSQSLKEINPFDWFRHHSEAEAPILWPPDAKSWLTGKDSDAGKDWGQEEKGGTENMIG